MDYKKKFLSTLDNIKLEKIYNHVSDFVDSDICKYLKTIDIIDNNDNKIIIIKYQNNKNINIIRKIKIKKVIIKQNISKNIIDRQNIKPFGKAINSNNKATIDKEIEINKNNNLDKNIMIIDTNNIKESKIKYSPPKNNLCKKKQVQVNKYIPPTIHNNIKLPKFKLKLDNISYDDNIDTINELLYNFIPVNNIHINIPKFTYGKNKGKNKGFVIIIFDKKSEYDKCFKELTNFKYNNLILNIKKI